MPNISALDFTSRKREKVLSTTTPENATPPEDNAAFTGRKEISSKPLEAASIPASASERHKTAVQEMSDKRSNTTRAWRVSRQLRRRF